MRKKHSETTNPFARLASQKRRKEHNKLNRSNRWPVQKRGAGCKRGKMKPGRKAGKLGTQREARENVKLGKKEGKARIRGKERENVKQLTGASQTNDDKRGKTFEVAVELTFSRLN